MILSIFAGLIAGGWIVALVVRALAPVGYEDAAGFHYGSPDQAVTTPCVLPPSHAFAQPA